MDARFLSARDLERQAGLVRRRTVPVPRPTSMSVATVIFGLALVAMALELTVRLILTAQFSTPLELLPFAWILFCAGLCFAVVNGRGWARWPLTLTVAWSWYESVGYVTEASSRDARVIALFGEPMALTGAWLRPTWLASFVSVALLCALTFAVVLMLTPAARQWFRRKHSVRRGAPSPTLSAHG